MNWPFMRIVCLSLLPFIAVSLALGCAGSDGPLVVPCKGKVTFAGGPCPKGGTITFSPMSVAAGMPRRPGSATFNEDGYFVVSSFGDGDGLVPGTYAAAISCWEGNPSGDDPGSFDRLNLVPADFSPEVVIAPDADEVEANFDVPQKKK